MFFYPLRAALGPCRSSPVCMPTTCRKCAALHHALHGLDVERRGARGCSPAGRPAAGGASAGGGATATTDGGGGRRRGLPPRPPMSPRRRSPQRQKRRDQDGGLSPIIQRPRGRCTSMAPRSPPAAKAVSSAFHRSRSCAATCQNPVGNPFAAYVAWSQRRFVAQRNPLPRSCLHASLCRRCTARTASLYEESA